MSEPTNVRQHPGLAKARLSLLAVAFGARVRASDAEWRAILAAADVVSEGSVRAEPAGSVWYGSTSLILTFPKSVTASAREFVAAVAARDIHVRLRALRIARREAASRAPGALGCSTCEIRATGTPEGVRIDVDIQAPLIERRHLGTGGGGK